MARVFVSHSSRDGEAAARLKAWLVDQGFEAPFLDFDKHTGIPPGADWERTLYRELSTSEAMLIVQTPSWLESKWCFAEFTQARALGKPIFPVVETPTGETLIAPDIQALDLQRDREGGLAQLARELTRIALDAQGGFPWDGTRPPFPGLLAFEIDDAAIYFGRDDDIRRLIERLNARRAQGGSKLLALMGASGSGKSSLLRAGVLPRLRRDRRGWIVTPPFRPQLHPVDELARMMAVVLDRPGDWRAMRDELHSDDPVRVLGDWAQDVRLAAGANEGHVLLAVDQAEELFGAADRDEALHFEAILGAALETPIPLMAVMALRSDSLESLQRSEALGGKFEEFSLGPLPLTRVPQIIEGPARVAGLEVDDELVLEATRDAVTEDALPLLAFALRELNDRYGQDARLTIVDYRALGDAVANLSPLENSVRKAADDVLSAARPSEDEVKALKDAFVPALVRVNDVGEYVRRPAVWTDLPAAAHALLERLVRARLLVRRKEGEANVVEVTHEALLRKWPRLRAWLDEERAFLIGRQHLEQDLRDWQQAPAEEKPKALLTGLKLARAESWFVERPQQLTDDERKFVQASVARARAEARRRARTRRLITVGSVAAAIILAIVAAFAFQQTQQALTEKARALDLARLSMATELKERDASTAALVLTELGDPDTPLAARKIAELLRLPLVHAELPHDEPATFMAFSPRGGRIVTVAGGWNSVTAGLSQSRGSRARVWDTATGKLLTEPLSHEEVVTFAAISSDETKLLTVAGKVVRVWDIEAGTVLQTWSQASNVLGANFLSGGGRVVVATEQDVSVYDIETGKRLLGDQPQEAKVTHLAVAPEQDWFAMASADGRVVVWNASSSMSFVKKVPSTRWNVHQLTWSPTGTALMAVSFDGIELWNVVTGEHWSTSEGANAAWFAPSGSQFVTTDRDGVTLWTLGANGRLGKIGEKMPGPGQVLAGAFHRGHDGVGILRGTGVGKGFSGDYSIYGIARAATTLATWYPKVNEPAEVVALTLDGDLIEAAFAPNGRLVATLSGTPIGSEGGRYEELKPDDTVRLWNVEKASERFARRLPGGEPALSPNAELVLTVDEKTVHLRRTADGSPHRMDPLLHDRPVSLAVFSPYGAALATLTDRAIHVHSLSAGSRSPVKVDLPAASASNIGFSSDSQLLWASGAYGVEGIWDASTGADLLPKVPSGCSDTREKRLDPAGRILVWVCQGHIHAWTRKESGFDGPVSWPASGAYSVSDVSPTTGDIAISVGNAVELRNADSGESRRIDFESEIRMVEFAPNGGALAVVLGSGVIKIIDPATGAIQANWSTDEVKRRAFAGQGRLLVTAHKEARREGVLRIWQINGRRLRSEIPLAAGSSENNWKIGEDGQSLVTWSGHTTRLWSLDTGEALFKSFDHAPKPKATRWMPTGDVAGAAVSPDRSYLVSATDKETLVWAIDGGSLRKILRATVGGCLLRAFRETVLGEPADEAKRAHEQCLAETGAAAGE